MRLANHKIRQNLNLKTTCNAQDIAWKLFTCTGEIRYYLLSKSLEYEQDKDFKNQNTHIEGMIH